MTERVLEALARKREGRHAERDGEGEQHEEDPGDIARRRLAEADADAVTSELRSQLKGFPNVQVNPSGVLRQEALIRDKVAQTRKQVLTTQDHSIDLNLLKREVDTNRQLYDSLLQRFKQLGVSSGVASSHVAVLDRAEPGARRQDARELLDPSDGREGRRRLGTSRAAQPP